MTVNMANIPDTSAAVKSGGSANVSATAGNSASESSNFFGNGQMSFIDMVLARVTSLQSTDNKSLSTNSDGSAKITSTFSSDLLNLVKLITPSDGINAVQNGTLETIPADALQAIKDFAASILSSANKGEITLSQETSDALKLLSNITFDEKGNVVFSDNQDTLVQADDSILSLVDNKSDNEEIVEKDAIATVVSETGDEDIILPASLLELLKRIKGLDIPESSKESDDGTFHLSKGEFSSLVAKLSEIVKTDTNKIASEDDASIKQSISDINDETIPVVISNNTQELASNTKEQSDASALAAMMNAIEPSDSFDDSEKEQSSESNDNALMSALLTEQSDEQKPLTAGTASTQNNSLSDNTSEEEMEETENGENYEWRTSKINTAAGKNSTSSSNGNQQESTNSKGNESTFGQMMQNAVSGDITDGVDSFSGDKIFEDNLNGLTSIKNITNIAGTSSASTLGATTTLARGMAGTSATASQQVSAQIFKSAVNGDSKINIKLYPEELGQVDVRLEMTKDGHTKALIIADKAETLALLQKDASELQKSLNDAGLQTGSDDLSFQLRQQNREANDGSPGRNSYGASNSVDNASGTEKTISVTLPENIITSNHVDYRI